MHQDHRNRGTEHSDRSGAPHPTDATLAAMAATADYEKLGAFYLGREVDRTTGETDPAPLLYDAKDLTTPRRDASA